MKFNRIFAVAALVVSLGAASAPAQDVKTDYDHNADFHRYHTFSFHRIQTADPLFESRVRDQITRDLTARGLQMVSSGGDLAVTAIGNTHAKQEYTSFYDGLGGGGWGWRGWRGWGGGWGGDTTTTVTEIPVGTLVVDLYDTQTHQLAWRGMASDQLSSKADKNTHKVDKAIDKMFDKFPPKGAQ